MAQKNNQAKLSMTQECKNFFCQAEKKEQMTADFATKIPQRLLDIKDKTRSNLFVWRGQFSPQLVETLIQAYCPENANILDPFVGSGTVLYEAARLGLAAHGFELNPAAWTFSKLYEFVNLPFHLRELAIRELQAKVAHEFPVVIFENDILPLEEVEDKIVRVSTLLGDYAKILCNALVVLLDIFNNQITGDFVQSKLMALAELVRRLPYSKKQIIADLQDARHLPLQRHSIDFVLSSPPYINVFNYHQNYRRSVETLGWDVLRVAKSEIGSNRANRGNRFLTVIQYCIDMAWVLQELARVVRPGGRIVLVVGYESKVLGVPFNNSKIIENLATQLGAFDPVLRQKRVFQNRYGQDIREDILNLAKRSYPNISSAPDEIGRSVAVKTLLEGMTSVADKNRSLLNEAVATAEQTKGTPVFDSADDFNPNAEKVIDRGYF